MDIEACQGRVGPPSLEYSCEGGVAEAAALQMVTSAIANGGAKAGSTHGTLLCKCDAGASQPLNRRE